MWMMRSCVRFPIDLIAARRQHTRVRLTWCTTQKTCVHRVLAAFSPSSPPKPRSLPLYRAVVHPFSSPPVENRGRGLEKSEVGFAIWCRLVIAISS